MPVVESAHRPRRARGHAARVGALAAWLLACGGPPPCVTSAECPGEQTCGLAGRCTPLASPEGAQFAGSTWLYARDWGIAGPDTAPLDDRLRVGGPRNEETLVTFGPLPPSGELLRAVLVLQPHETSPRLESPVALVVEAVGPYRGGVLPRRSSVTPARFAAARRLVAPGPPRDLRVDVTHAARRAGDASSRTLYLLLRSEDTPALRFASPHHTDSRQHPRLELMVH